MVIAQANGGTKLFVDEADYQFYVSMLRQMVRDRVLKVFAYCLMENELRLVVAPIRLSLSRIIQRLHGRHTARMNDRQNRIGHLFRGRFRSLVFAEDELVEVVRSVHLWPVRVGLLRRPELYPYSSHATYAEKSSSMADFLHTKQVLSSFQGDQEAKKRAFVRYVELVALEPDNFGVDEIHPGIGAKEHNKEQLLLKAKLEDFKRPKKSSVKMLAERASLLLSISQDQLTG
ncbi:MAG TPA: transposase, partial [Myxococcota bacterium]|nr:transposase [Myxococcota bacterium]